MTDHPQLRASRFTTVFAHADEEGDTAFEGYSGCSAPHGPAGPGFTREVADRIVAAFNRAARARQASVEPVHPRDVPDLAWYDPARDEYVFVTEVNLLKLPAGYTLRRAVDEGIVRTEERFPGVPSRTPDDEECTLYWIGAGSWAWDELPAAD